MTQNMENIETSRLNGKLEKFSLKQFVKILLKTDKTKV